MAGGGARARQPDRRARGLRGGAGAALRDRPPCRRRGGGGRGLGGAQRDLRGRALPEGGRGPAGRRPAAGGDRCRPGAGLRAELISCAVGGHRCRPPPRPRRPPGGASLPGRRAGGDRRPGGCHGPLRRRARPPRLRFAPRLRQPGAQARPLPGRAADRAHRQRHPAPAGGHALQPAPPRGGGGGRGGRSAAAGDRVTGRRSPPPPPSDRGPPRARLRGRAGGFRLRVDGPAAGRVPSEPARRLPGLHARARLPGRARPRGPRLLRRQAPGGRLRRQPCGAGPLGPGRSVRGRARASGHLLPHRRRGLRRSVNDCLSLPLRQGSSGIRPLTDWEALWMPLGEGEAERLPAGRGQGWEPVEVPRQLAASEGRQAVWYRTSLARPDHSGRVVLRIGGAFLATHVWLNGKLLGSHYGYFAPFGFDLTPYLRTENLLVICCEAPVEISPDKKRHIMGLFNDGDLKPYPASAYASLPDRYQWEVPVGLWRPVELEYVGPITIDWMRMKPHFEGGDGRLEVEARLRNLDGRQMEGQIEVAVSSANGEDQPAPLRIHRDVRLAGGGEQTVSMQLALPAAKRWEPWRFGAQPMYRAEMVARAVGGVESTRVEDTFG